MSKILLSSTQKVGWFLCNGQFANYKKLIKFYGGEDNIKLISYKLSRELEIYKKALGNTQYDLLDLVKMHVPSFCLALTGHFSRIPITSHKISVWKHYIELGGNYNVVIYGYIEYLCRIYDPHGHYVQSQIKRLLTNENLTKEILLYKELC